MSALDPSSRDLLPSICSSVDVELAVITCCVDSAVGAHCDISWVLWSVNKLDLEVLVCVHFVHHKRLISGDTGDSIAISSEAQSNDGVLVDSMVLHLFFAGGCPHLDLPVVISRSNLGSIW